ncbi:MAG: flagellar hook-basal body complex protein, partial [Myxococcota bacterium]
MGHGLYTATAGAVARRTQLDLVANNLANAGTIGYRAQKVSFSEVLQDSRSPNRHLVAMGRPLVSWERGAIESTERPLDLVLQEDGFFVAEGIEGRVLLKTVSARVDADGSIRDSVGRRLQLAGGDERLDAGSPVTVGQQGQLVQHGREVGRLLTVDVVDPRALR